MESEREFFNSRIDTIIGFLCEAMRFADAQLSGSTKGHFSEGLQEWWELRKRWENNTKQILPELICNVCSKKVNLTNVESFGKVSNELYAICNDCYKQLPRSE